MLRRSPLAAPIVAAGPHGTEWILYEREANRRPMPLALARTPLAAVCALWGACAAMAWAQAPPAAPAVDPTTAAAAARGAWYEGFEGPDPSWRAAGGDVPCRIDRHERVSDVAHTGQRCEHFAITGDGGTCVYICHDVGQAMVIDELIPTLWIKSDRTGLQLFAEVVLPHAQDPRTGRIVSTLIAGTSYSTLGAWQQLRIDDLPRLVARKVRCLRPELGPQIDEREPTWCGSC